MRGKYNTILEGFGALSGEAFGDPTNTLDGRTSTNRGQILGFDIVHSYFDVIDGSLSVEVGGVDVLDGVPLLPYYYESREGRYNLIPLKINDGQTFQLKYEDLDIPAGTSFIDIVFIREGFNSFGCPDRLSSKLSTHKFTPEVDVETQTTATLIRQTSTGLIPRNRGEVIGFEIDYAIPFSFQDPTDLLPRVTFLVGGVEIIKNVPITVFSDKSSREYQLIFMELMAGDTFELVIEADPTIGGSIQYNQYVSFYFDSKTDF